MALWGNTDQASSKPKYLNTADKAATVGVDVAEAQNPANIAKGINTPGWVKTVTYTDAQGNTRNKNEVLVALSSLTGDAVGETVPSAVITIGTQPIDTSALVGETASFLVAATVTDSAVLSYQWQKSTNGRTWSNIVGATSASYTTGTLAEIDSGTRYRVIVSATRGAVPVTSDIVTLTVTA